MNKNAIKKFAIEARKKLIASVSDRAGMLGITPEGCSEPVSKGVDFEVYKTIAGTEITLGKSQCEQRRKLKEQVETRGFEAVVEEVAYTWFNRICAIRFIEVNDYLPTRVRVLSSEKEGKNEPDIVTQAPDVDLDFTDKEREYILDCKMNNKLDDLFKMLFIKQCNKLSEILPELFEATEDYTEMLLNISYTNKDDIIYMLVNQETGIPESDFNVSTIGEDGQPTGQVEIIGWLYQYYNTELKDDTFAQLKKNIKISKERIPAATQLFTPDWIVRYMVENSVGRLWIEHLRAVDPTVNEKEVAEKFGWKYYLPEAEQEADVNMKLAEIRTSYKDLKPEDITCIDPCMGSGHILVAMFDVLMDIYKSAGYSERDAAFEIVEHNIHGLDIDKRAYQLAYFAVMMKGRGYNRRFFRGKNDSQVIINIYAIRESNEIDYNHLKYMGAGFDEDKKAYAFNQIMKILDTFNEAREYGSILNLEKFDFDLIKCFIEESCEAEQLSFDSLGLEDTKDKLRMLINIANIMTKPYYSVITNPPYMGTNGMGVNLANYVKDNYPNSKPDMFSVFIEKCNNMVKENGYVAMITQPSFLFLSSFAKLRNMIILNNQITSLLHMGRGIFGIDFGSTAFVVGKKHVTGYNGNYFRLHERTFQYIDSDDIKKLFLASKTNKNFRFNFSEYDTKNEVLSEELGSGKAIQLYYQMKQDEFLKLPGLPMAYWVSKTLLNDFAKGEALKILGDTRQGMATSDNNRFLRLWYEVPFDKIGLGCVSSDDALNLGKKWYPYNKGGDYRKWYGNMEYTINYENDGLEVKDYATSLYKTPTRTIKSMSEYFKPCLSWSKISAGSIAFRYYPHGFIFDVAGCCIFYKDKRIMLYDFGFINSCVAKSILSAISPTLNYEAGHVASLPVIRDERYIDCIGELVESNIEISKADWDAFEVSWDFRTNPLVCGYNLISDAFESWKKICEERVVSEKTNEEKINSIFIEIYGLRNEMESNIDDDDIIIRRADLQRDIKNLISYAVGCMFGRYSLDEEGLILAGGDLDISKYQMFVPDNDGIIPITDDEYFSDDIVGLFVKWIKVVFGEQSLEENLNFIAQALGNKGNSAVEVIRNYFVSDFYKEHCNMYSVTGSGKRPIYWLFDSGKENGFKCLIYMHRYNADTIGKIRIDYLHKTQKAIEQAMRSAEYIRDNASSGGEKSSATKRMSKYTKQLAEIKQYDEAMAHIANQRIELDLDDGVKVNYAKFQGVEVAREGKKAIKVDLLAKI